MQGDGKGGKGIPVQFAILPAIDADIDDDGGILIGEMSIEIMHFADCDDDKIGMCKIEGFVFFGRLAVKDGHVAGTGQEHLRHRLSHDVTTS